MNVSGSAQSRPSNSLDDYFEGENKTPGDRIYEFNTRNSTSINDRVFVVSP